MAQPDTPSAKGHMPDDDLDKQIEDMLETIEAGSDALFDAVNEASAESSDAAFGEITDSIVDDESALGVDAPVAQSPDSDDSWLSATGPEPVSGASEIDNAVGDALAEADAALDEVVEDDGASASGAELDAAIAEAVADAEGAVDRNAFDPPTRDAAPIDAEDDEVAAAIEKDVARELASQTGELEAIEDLSESVAVEVATESEAEASADEPEAPHAEPASGADARAEPAEPMGAGVPAAEPSGEPANSDAPAEVKTRPGGRLIPAARSVWAKVSPISVKVGAAAAHGVSRPLVMLSPATRDYVGYAAAVTAFMGVCVWVFSLI